MNEKKLTIIMPGIAFFFVMAIVTSIFMFAEENEGIKLADTSYCPAGFGYLQEQNKCSKCAAGYYSAEGASTCSQCPAGYWAEAGSASCNEKCPAGYACSNGTKKKCNVNVPAGSSACKDCDVWHCKTCAEGKNDYCAKCEDGYNLTSIGKCVKVNNSTTSSSDGCYINNTTNEYDYGNYQNNTSYTYVSADAENCNKLTIKMVDASGMNLSGSTISWSPSQYSGPINYSLGPLEIKQNGPDTYKIKEINAPSNYQIDSNEITFTVDANGIINVTSNSNIDLGTTNNSRNVTITWKKASSGKCFMRYISPESNNEYCFGTSETCSGFSNVLDGRDQNSCQETDACYRTSTGSYIMGKYANRNGYAPVGNSCPMCYTNPSGEQVWGNFEGVAGYNKVFGLDESKCLNKNGFLGSNMLFILIILVIVLVIVLIIYKMRQNSKNDNKPVDPTESDDYNYNYRI